MSRLIKFITRKHSKQELALKENLVTKLTGPILIPLLILIVLEVVYTGSLFNFVDWIIEYPKEFLFNYVIVFGIANVFYILPRRFYLAASSLLLAFFTIIGIISHEKLVIKGSPLVPTDLYLAKEASAISGRFISVDIAIAVVGIIVLVLTVLIIKKTPGEKYNCPRKIVVFIGSFLLLTFCYTSFGYIQNALSLQIISYSQPINYSENGMLLGFLLEAEFSKVDAPANYQQNVVDQIVQSNKAAYTSDPNFKPNVIFVMSEAFWDPTLMKNIKFNKDPIPVFHSLEKTQTSGTMLSAVFGGGTANTEFEAMTGFSTQFLPSGSIAYSQYVTKPIEALPTIYERQGYTTSAIHTYDDWFYNRENVYKDLGFSKFVSKEFYNDPLYRGQYISDTVLTDQILKEVNQTSNPDFIYAVSMEDHGPYSATENPGNTIKATGANLTPESQAILDNYANTISDVDKSLGQLIEGLQKSSQPTLVIFYGDHLPLLGDNYSVYKQAGFIKDDNSYQDYLNLHSVPFVTWNNFSTTSTSTVKHNLRLSANFMGTLALEMSEKSGSPMTDFLSNLMKNGSDTTINRDFMNNEKMTPDEMEQYTDLQYDLLFGKQYTYQLEPSHKPPINNGYIQGDGPVEITGLSSANVSTVIQGQNFVENDKVYVNGKQVKSTYNGPNSITITSPKGSGGKKETIQIKLADSMNTVISKSNVFNF